jgi:proteasome lid subunit RPN8/RPN11
MEPIGLLQITNIQIPLEFVEGIYDEFRKTGAQGYERLALFAGMKAGETFTVTQIVYPKQYLTRGPQGLSFFVEGEELERIGDWLFEQKLSLIGQIHSHPAEAYHSEADDDMAIITKYGSISIVVPDFGNSDYMLQGSAFYRLMPQLGWTALAREEIIGLIKIIV